MSAEVAMAAYLARQRFDARGGGCPLGLARGKLGIGYFYIHFIIGDVDFDDVAFLHQADGAADGGFGADVADACAACAAARIGRRL